MFRNGYISTAHIDTYDLLSEMQAKVDLARVEVDEAAWSTAGYSGGGFSFPR